MNKSILMMIFFGIISITNTSIQAEPVKDTLYKRLGGYTGISAVVDDLVTRLASDQQLGRFYAHRGADGVAREKQLTKDFITSAAGGPVVYRGRDMKLAHAGMRMSNSDWKAFISLLHETLNKFNIQPQEQKEVGLLMNNLKSVIVEK